MNLEAFGERLAMLRIKKGVSARDMSLSIGQSANYINKIENKKALPSMNSFFYLCEYLGISQTDFFDEGSDNPKKLNELVADLKRLDETTLSHIAGLVKEVLRRA